MLTTMLETLLDRFASGELQPLPTEVVPFERALDGFRRMARAQHIGKIVFEVSADTTRAAPRRARSARPTATGVPVDFGLDVFRRVLSWPHAPTYVLAMGAPVEGAGSGARAHAARGGRARPRRAGLKTPFRAPEGDVEIALAKLWEKTLGIAPIGVDDDFVELGGDSIEAIQIQHAIHREFDLRVRNTEFLSEPTIAALARLIDERRPAARRSPTTPGWPCARDARRPGRLAAPMTAAAPLMCRLTSRGATPALDFVPSLGHDAALAGPARARDRAGAPGALVRVPRDRGRRAAARDDRGDRRGERRRARAPRRTALPDRRPLPRRRRGVRDGRGARGAGRARRRARRDRRDGADLRRPCRRGADRRLAGAATLVAHFGAIVQMLTARSAEMRSHLEPDVARPPRRSAPAPPRAGVDYRARPLRAPCTCLRTADGDDAGRRRVGALHPALKAPPAAGDTLSMLRPPHVESVGRVLGAC
jgi:acyl carrier protein